MARKFTDLTKNWTPDRKARVAQKAADLRREMSLAEIRKAFGLAQSQVAQSMGVSQGLISQLEKQPDFYLSTLRRFLGAMNIDLVLVARQRDGHEDIEIKLDDLTPAAGER